MNLAKILAGACLNERALMGGSMKKECFRFGCFSFLCTTHGCLPLHGKSKHRAWLVANACPACQGGRRARLVTPDASDRA